ncbi:LEA family epithelial adhesin, partial [Lactobacillus delbrueckii]
KTPVGDNSHLTDDEKSQVKDNVQKSNSNGTVTNVDDQGNTTITYPDGSKNVISGKDTTTETSTPIAGPDQFTQTVNYVDGKGEVIGSQDYVGKEKTTQDFTGQ